MVKEDPDRDQLIEWLRAWRCLQALAAVDALLLVLADRDKRKLREGRNQAAEAIEASDYFAVPSTRLMASYIAGLARGGSTDEERNDE